MTRHAAIDPRGASFYTGEVEKERSYLARASDAEALGRTLAVRNAIDLTLYRR